MPDGETLLVNFWYAHPLGHVVEALRYSLGYHRADPSLRVSVALNRASGVELTALCPWIGRTYATDYTSFLEPGDDVTSALSVVPRQWDWIVDDARGHDEAQLAAFAGLRGYYVAAAAYFEARRARGLAGARPPAYLPHQQVVLGLPDEARACARRELGQGQPRIALMPAGSGMRSAYPSSRYWRLVLHELRVRYPDVVVCLIGKLRRNERTSTSMTPDEVAELASVSPRVVDPSAPSFPTQSGTRATKGSRPPSSGRTMKARGRGSRA